MGPAKVDREGRAVRQDQHMHDKQGCVPLSLANDQPGDTDWRAVRAVSMAQISSSMALATKVVR